MTGDGKNWIMRRVIFLLLAGIGLFPVKARAAWEEYMYSDLGIAKEFPAEPTVGSGTYDTAVAGNGSVPSAIYSVEQDNIVYRMTVADLRAPEYISRGANIYAECIFRAEQEGTVLAKMPQRVEDGVGYRVYGHLTSVDLFDNQGRKQTNCFVTKGRLFKIEAIVLAAHGLANTSQAIRFSTSLRFRIDGTIYEAP
nr:MAG: hypothetical protein E4H34_04615 [Hyphomicrobiales bacterium]